MWLKIKDKDDEKDVSYVNCWSVTAITPAEDCIGSLIYVRSLNKGIYCGKSPEEVFRLLSILTDLDDADFKEIEWSSKKITERMMNGEYSR